MHTLRRTVLAAGAATSVLPQLGSAASQPSDPSVPALHRRRIGGFEVTALGDGQTGFQQAWITGSDPAAMAALAQRAFLPVGPMPTAVNAFAIRSADHLILVDTGAGRFWDPANCGRLAAPLAAAGLSFEQVDAVFITHLHADHAGGLLMREGDAPRFPRAELLLPEAEIAFWSDPGSRSRAPERMQAGFDRAAAWIAPYAGRTTRVAAGAEIAPGLRAVSLHGHTPGHTGLLLGDGAERLLFMADLVQVGPLQFPRPDWNTILDADREAATAIRRRTLDMAATERLLVAGSHLSFPGLGYIVKDSEGYGFVLAPWPIGS